MPKIERRSKKILKRIEEEISLGTFDYQRFFPNGKMAARFAGGCVRIDGVAGDDPSGLPAATSVANHSASPLFRDFAETWYLENQVSWRNSYRKTVRTTIEKHLIPMFGEKRVSLIAKADILTLRAELAKAPGRVVGTSLSSRRINAVMTPLRQILNEASERFEFTTPFRNIKPLKVQKSDVEPFSLEDVRLILARVRADFHNYYLVRFFTGMRTGEVDGLQWKYVDFYRRQILVRETVVNGELTTTKTVESQRDIQMSLPVFDVSLRQACMKPLDVFANLICQFNTKRRATDGRNGEG